MKKHLSFKRMVLGFAILVLSLILGYCVLLIMYNKRHQNVCLKEGESYSWRDSNNHLPCCPGLKAIDTTMSYDEKNGCSFYMSSTYTCSKCGDDLCGDRENECNCPEDCVDEDSKASVIWE